MVVVGLKKKHTHTHTHTHHILGMYVEEDAQPRWQHDMRNLQSMDLVYDMIRYDMLRYMYLARYTV